MKKMCPTCKREYAEIHNYCTKCGIELVKESGTVYVKIVPDESPVLDEAFAKAERLRDLMKEAMELASSIANMDLDLRLRAVFDDKSTELARITTE